MDKFDICVAIENELKNSEDRVIIVNTPLAEEVATLLEGVYYVDKKEETVIVSSSEELMKEEMKKL